MQNALVFFDFAESFHAVSRSRSFGRLACIALLFLGASAASARELRLEIAAEKSSVFQVFYGHIGLDFTAENSVIAGFRGGGEFQELSFKIPDWEPLTLRLDPGSLPGVVSLRRVRLLENDGRVIGALSNSALQPFQQLVPVRAESKDEAISFRIPAGDDDPFIVVNEVALGQTLAAKSHVTRGAFAAVALLLGAVLLGGSIVAVRWTLSPQPSLRKCQLLTGGALLLFTAGVRLHEMSTNASWAPYLDEFEGELATLIRPFRADLLRWGNFTAAHNDHRITTTRAISLAAVLLNGEWDNRVLVVTSCLLQAASVAWVGMFLLPLLGRRDFFVLLAFISATALLLNDWANLAVGFQIQFHLVLLSSLMSLTLMPNARFGSMASLAGFGAGLFAAASLGSGFVALVAAGAGMAMRMWTERKLSMVALGIILLSAAVAVFAWEHRAIFPAHDYLRAKDIPEFLLALWTYGAWPLAPWSVCAVLLWLPWFWVTGWMLFRRRSTPTQLFNFSLGVWLLLQILALAWGRAGFAPVMSSRYSGMLAWSSVVAILSIVELRKQTNSSSELQRPHFRWAPAGLAVVMFGALAFQSYTFLGAQLPGFRVETREQENRLGTFMRYNDPKVFTEVDFPHKPYPFDQRLVELLRDPFLRDIWPAPMQRERFRFSDPAALARVRPGPLTELARGLLNSGLILVAIAALLLVWSLRRQSRVPSTS